MDFDSTVTPSGPIKLKRLKTSRPLPLGLISHCPKTGVPISTSLHAAAWYQMLQRYPDRQWAYRLVHDIIYGVDIGFVGCRNRTVQSKNFLEDPLHETAIEEDINKDLHNGRIIGPYLISKMPWKYFHSSPIMTVVKKGSGKVRVVHHLSYPRGNSINTYTKDWLCVLSRFAQATKMVCSIGRSCHMAKMDIKSAYRLIPIRPADWPLLGFTFHGHIYFHTTLPFGLKSSCHIWERYSTAAEWIIKNELNINNIMHYVDDSFMVEATETACQEDVDKIETMFNQLGLTVAKEKTVGPTTRITFLGIQIDSVEMTIGLDSEKVSSIRTLLTEWLDRETCSLHQLLSIVGILSWAANVVAHGRTFVQHLRLLAQLHNDVTDSRDETLIRITTECREDLQWWQSFMAEWNGISLLWDQEWLEDNHGLQPHTDACNSGYGAVCGRQWFHAQWTPEQQQLAEEGTISRDSMPFKELYALVTAAITWGHQWNRKRITFRTDCEPAVISINKGTSRNKRMMQLLRTLHYHAAKHHFKYRAVHIPGVDNVIADELSRVHCFSQLSHQCRSSIDHSPTTPVLPSIPT